MKHYYLSFVFLFNVVVLYSQPYFVGHSTITFNDPNRTGGFGSGGGPGRQIQTEVYYPATAAGENTPVAIGQFPVVVFGHGFVMVWDAYQPVYDSLVRNGYVVALPRTEGGVSPSHTEFGNDLALVLNRMLLLHTTSGSLFENKLNGRGAIGGHSMGGGCTFLADQFTTNASCYFSFAAANTNPSAINVAATITRPQLVLAGTYDCVAPPAQHQEPIYTALASACKTFVNITGAYHCRFSAANTNCLFGEGTCFPPSNGLTQDQQLAAVRNFLNPYLDYYLKGECEAWTDFQNKINASVGVTTQQSCSNTVPANASISGALEFCSGNSTTLTAQPTGFNYEWSTGENTASISVSTIGQYAVTVSNSICAEEVSAVSVSEIAMPVAPPSIMGLDSICYFDTPLLYSVVQPGSGNNSWVVGGTAFLSDVTDTSVAVTAGQDYTLYYISSNVCGVDTTSLGVVFNESPSTAIQLTDDTFCIGDSILVTVFDPPGVYYDWVFPLDTGWGILSRQGSSAVFISANIGSNLLQLTASSPHCSLATSAVLTVVDTPQLSIISSNGYFYATPGFNSYLWTINGMPAGTADSVIMFTPGVYVVIATNEVGCEGMADNYFVDHVLESNTSSLRVFPTLFQNELLLQSDEDIAGELLNSLGQPMAYFSLQSGEALTLSTEAYAAGVYVFRCRNGAAFKLIKP